MDPGGATWETLYPLLSAYIFEGCGGSLHIAKKKKIEAWQYLHGMIEMFTYLNLPILFGIILLCRIINIARCMYLVVYCSPEMKCLVTSYVKTKYNNFANINLFKAPECE